MSTFLFAAGARTEPAEMLLRRALAVTQRVMPSMGVARRSAITLLPEINGGWGWLAPEPEQPPLLVGEVVAPDRAVLAFGDLEAAPGVSAAAAVAAAWQSGGLDAVRRLDGRFSAVLVDRRQRRVWLASDFIGRRYLRYWAKDGLLLVSPHDLLLVATRQFTPRLDPDVLATIVVWNGSMHNRSLLAGVQSCRPTGFVQWAEGRAEAVEQPALDLRARPEARDARAVDAQIERMVALMQEDARRQVAAHPQPHIELDLTAGKDTRMVLALLRSVAPQERLRAVCNGEPESLDVRTSRAIARRCGTAFTSSVPPLPDSPEAFFLHCDLRAFYMNGDTSAKRALTAPPRYRREEPLHTSGRSGALVNGTPFETARQWRYPADAPREKTFWKLFDHFTKHVRTFPWPDAEAASRAFLQHLHGITAPYERTASGGHDLYHVTYLYERDGVWGNMPARFPWLRNTWSPFDSTAVVRAAFMLPPPIARHCRIHARIVGRYLPQAYWLRINGGERMALEYRSGAWRLLEQLDRRWNKFRQRVAPPAPATQPGARSMDILRAQAVCGPWASVIRELLLAQGSLAQAVFGRDGIDTLFTQLAGGQWNRLDPIGLLVTAERWRLLVQETARLAASSEV